ncbi:hypothetical protein RND81_08G027400 [Saponaria officinalis]|uniref:F-box domain-containing protein n=1 Tax=Saponaria officinalis TaxID=3572 RepID=A0AAW1J2R7_SAPOF
MWRLTSTFPLEIIIDIVVRLPIKSIFRFKCVCKSWYILIQSNEFFKLHTNRSLKTNTYNCSLILPITRKLTVHGIQAAVHCLCRAYLNPNQTMKVELDLGELALPLSFRPSLDKVSSRDYRFLSATNNVRWDRRPIVYGKFEVVGSCNGLVLISSGKYHVAICNPCIEHEDAFKILPCIEYPYLVDHYYSHDNEYFRKYYTGYRSREITFRVFGLGYNSINCVYKIVYLTSKRALIYSLANDGRFWRPIDLSYDVINYDLDPSWDGPKAEREKRVLMQVYGLGVATNNHLHWNITEFDPDVYEYSRGIILSFDICNEKWGRVPVFDEFAMKSHILKLGVVNGCSCLLIPRGTNRQSLELWMMKEYGVKESWTKMFKVPNGSGIPLFYHKDRHEFLLSGIQHGLGWFNPRDNKIRKVEFYGCDFSGENYYSNRPTILSCDLTVKLTEVSTLIMVSKNSKVEGHL